MSAEQALVWAADCLGESIARVETLPGGMTSTMLGLTCESGSSAVLRLMTNEPWRTHGAALTERERTIQLMLANTGVPAPRSLAIDATGRHCGDPAHLMSRLPGALGADRVDSNSLLTVARVLAEIHSFRPADRPRDYQSWAWEAKFVVPSWASRPDEWDHAFEILRMKAPDYEPTFIHRDFHHRNLLWAGEEITGVVDWVETSTGPAWLDVAHCRTNLALNHGTAVADAFAAAYADLTGRVGDPYWDVMDVVGFLPPPGKPMFSFSEAQILNLEDHLSAVLISPELPIR